MSDPEIGLLEFALRNADLIEATPPPLSDFIRRMLQPDAGKVVLTFSTPGHDLPRIWGEQYRQDPETGKWELHVIEFETPAQNSYAAGCSAFLALSGRTFEPGVRGPGSRPIVVDDIDADFRPAPGPGPGVPSGDAGEPGQSD